MHPRRRGLRKVAVTNAPRDNTALMLRALQLDRYFEAVVLGEECERPKPFPDPYQAGLRALGLQPHEALAIEDSPSGVCERGWCVGTRVCSCVSGPGLHCQGCCIWEGPLAGGPRQLQPRARRHGAGALLPVRWQRRSIAWLIVLCVWQANTCHCAVPHQALLSSSGCS